MDQTESTPEPEQTTAPLGIAVLLVSLVRQLLYHAGGYAEVIAPFDGDPETFESLLRGLDARGVMVTYDEPRGVYCMKLAERPPEINNKTGRCFNNADLIATIGEVFSHVLKQAKKESSPIVVVTPGEKTEDGKLSVKVSVTHGISIIAPDMVARAVDDRPDAVIIPDIEDRETEWCEECQREHAPIGEDHGGSNG